jgi:hypothetical protein
MHSRHSTLRERIVEYVFAAEALRTLWRRGVAADRETTVRQRPIVFKNPRQ